MRQYKPRTYIGRERQHWTSWAVFWLGMAAILVLLTVITRLYISLS